MKFELNINGIDEFAAALDEIANTKAVDFTDVADSVQQVFLEDAKLRFDSSPAVESGGEVYGGVYWAALARSTLKLRAGGKILIDSGDLERSLTADGDANNIFEIDGTEIIFGSLLPYASDVNKTRPFLFWHPLLLDKVSAAISQWLVEDIPDK